MRRAVGTARLPWRPLSSPTRFPVDQPLTETLPRVDPPTVVESASRGLRSWSRRRVWAALLAVAIAVVSAIVLQRPAGPASLDREPHISRGPALPPITANAPTEQAFTARADELSGIVARVGTYGGATRCSVNVVVSDPNGAVVGRRVIRCRDLVDNELRLLIRFRPLPRSKGERFHLTVSAQPGARQAISLWGAESGSRLPPALSGGKLQRQSVALITEYGKRRPLVDIVGIALRRMAQYRVAWWRPPVVAGMMMTATLLLVALVAVPRRLSVAALLSLALIKGVFWTVAMPPLQGPDESSHFAYSQFMAEEGAIPRRGTSVSGLPPYSDELRRAERLLHREADPPGNRPDFGPGSRGADESRFQSRISRRAGGDASAAGYSPVYYAPASLLYRATSGPIYTRISTMRLWSVALGLLSVWLALLIGRRLFPESEGAALALAVGVALQPMFSQQTAVINNDALVIAGGFLCLLVAMKLVEPGASRWLPLLGGLALGTTLLGKPFGLAMAPVLAFGWLVGWLRSHPRTWKAWPVALARFGLGVGVGALRLSGGVVDIARGRARVPFATGLPAPAEARQLPGTEAGLGRPVLGPLRMARPTSPRVGLQLVALGDPSGHRPRMCMAAARSRRGRTRTKRPIAPTTRSIGGPDTPLPPRSGVDPRPTPHHRIPGFPTNREGRHHPGSVRTDGASRRRGVARAPAPSARSTRARHRQHGDRHERDRRPPGDLGGPHH
ncbi:MAG: DUF2142 domain-containing protein [Actinobacteria bacterium]|nr:MAG: DUF2142 domain-containing protein [Actinomycetota bacterium]